MAATNVLIEIIVMIIVVMIIINTYNFYWMQIELSRRRDYSRSWFEKLILWMESDSGTTFKTLLSSNVDGLTRQMLFHRLLLLLFGFAPILAFQLIFQPFQPTILPGTPPHLHCNNVHPKKCNQCSQNLCPTERLPKRGPKYFFFFRICAPNWVELWPFGELWFRR